MASHGRKNTTPWSYNQDLPRFIPNLSPKLLSSTIKPLVSGILSTLFPHHNYFFLSSHLLHPQLLFRVVFTKIFCLDLLTCSCHIILWQFKVYTPAPTGRDPPDLQTHITCHLHKSFGTLHFPLHTLVLSIYFDSFKLKVLEGQNFWSDF